MKFYDRTKELALFADIYNKSQPFTLIIDEFQDWLRINPSIFSEMQREWDLAKGKSKMNLINTRCS